MLLWGRCLTTLCVVRRGVGGRQIDGVPGLLPRVMRGVSQRYYCDQGSCQQAIIRMRLGRAEYIVPGLMDPRCE